MKAPASLVTALLVFTVVLAAVFIFFLIWWLVAPKSWYFNLMKDDMTCLRGLRGFYKRYGETEATEILAKYVTVRLAKISAQLAGGVEADLLEKGRYKLDVFMRNVIDALRTLHLDGKVFPGIE